MYTVEITGFKTIEQAEEFANWYLVDGEKDSIPYFKNSKESGKIDVEEMPVSRILNKRNDKKIEVVLSIK